MGKITRKNVEYTTRNLEIKNRCFNYILTRYTRKFIRANPGKNYSIDIIDSRDMQSTAALRRRGIRNPINAITRNLQDYHEMRTRRRDVSKQYVEGGAVELYRSEEFARRKYVIVWHDGQQLGRTTLRDVKQLIDNQHESIGLAVNMAMRCPKKSHRSFGNDIVKYATANGYRTKYTKLQSYSQNLRGGYMQPYWVEMTKESISQRETICIDLTDE